jgi:hypothetical protein
MPKPSDQSSASEGNLLLAVCLLVTFAGMASVTTAYTAGFVVDQLQNTDALVMLVVDGGKLKSDSADLERNMSSATLALQSVRDLGLALSFGCLAVAVAVGIRVWRGRRQA